MAGRELIDHGYEVVVGQMNAGQVVLFDLDVAVSVERELPTQAEWSRVVVVVHVVFGEYERPAARWNARQPVRRSIDVDERPPIRVQLIQDRSELPNGHEPVSKALTNRLGRKGQLRVNYERMEEQVLHWPLPKDQWLCR